jgi:hypothetical protein
MGLEERIKAFTELGKILRAALSGEDSKYSREVSEIIDRQHLNNQWFTPSNVRMAFNAIADQLTEENLLKWCGAYPLLREKEAGLTIGIIMAGNIPLVGFHDFLSVLITGNRLIAKTSSKDSELIKFVSDILCSAEPAFHKLIRFTDGALSDFDAVIATGSNNSSRYFEYYFGRYPHIIRKNRNSIAILDGTESDQALDGLGTDVFSYFGLGCRNVSKIYLPAGFNLSLLEERWKKHSGLTVHPKYANNYDFNKAVFLVNREPFTDFGYLLLKEDNRISSPVSVLYYEFYDSYELLRLNLGSLAESVQCTISTTDIPFGTSQMPQLWDYADGIDTIEFILKKIIPRIS